ncbi:hypothetical protein SO802_017927 [Lithocarpus litseifolius]|uniref:Uncharacterized protein n=1 Tax=Lithocarpus litseifolius TaxID=425828 RepID=A0AAW2CMC2_9ROSI
MLAPHFMTNAEYDLWGSGVPNVERLLEGLDYEKFNITRLMPSLIAQEEPATGELIDPPHLPWTVYACGLDGFVREHAVPHNPNVISYPFPPNTQALEVTNYSRNLYDLGGAACPSSGGNDDDDDDGGDEKDSEATPNYQSRKRRHH